jgi:hypothetical protein
MLEALDFEVNVEVGPLDGLLNAEAQPVLARFCVQRYETFCRLIPFLSKNLQIVTKKGGKAAPPRPAFLYIVILYLIARRFPPP